MWSNQPAVPEAGLGAVGSPPQSFVDVVVLGFQINIVTRSLDNPHRQTAVRRFLGRTPELAAGVIFLASTMTEISQYFRPKGIFPGTFDLLDILAYATGIGICYLFDRRTLLQRT